MEKVFESSGERTPLMPDSQAVDHGTMQGRSVSSIDSASMPAQKTAKKVNWLIFGLLLFISLPVLGAAGWIYLAVKLNSSTKDPSSQGREVNRAEATLPQPSIIEPSVDPSVQRAEFYASFKGDSSRLEDEGFFQRQMRSTAPLMIGGKSISIVNQYAKLLKDGEMPFKLFFGRTERKDLPDVKDALREVQMIKARALEQAIGELTMDGERLISPQGALDLRERVRYSDDPLQKVYDYEIKIRKAILKAVGDGQDEITKDADAVIQAIKEFGCFTYRASAIMEPKIRDFFSRESDGIARCDFVKKLISFGLEIQTKAEEIQERDAETIERLERVLPQRTTEALAHWSKDQDKFPPLDMRQPFAVAQVVLSQFAAAPPLSDQEMREAAKLRLHPSCREGTKVTMLPPRHLDSKDPLRFPLGEVYPMKIEKVVDFVSVETGEKQSFKVVEMVEIVAPSMLDRPHPCVVRIHRSVKPL